MSFKTEVKDFVEQLVDEAENEICREFLRLGLEPEEVFTLKEEHHALKRVRRALNKAIEEAKR